MNNNAILVYGSLRDGFHNNGLLTRHNAEYLTNTLVPNYVMHSLGGFPMIVSSPKLPKGLNFPWATNIVAELWVVNDACMEDLDALEGHPNWYKREQIRIPNWTGNCNLYVGSLDYVERHSYGVVASGNWERHRDNPAALIKDWKGVQPSKKEVDSLDASTERAREFLRDLQEFGQQAPREQPRRVQIRINPAGGGV